MRIVRRRGWVGVQGSFRVLSSAPWHGGLRRALEVVNVQVPLSFDCGVRRFFRDLGPRFRRRECVGLLTSVDVTTAVVERRPEATALVTAGIGNSASVGTINSIVVLRGRPSVAAMVEAVKVVTEAKCAALRDLDVRARDRPATGTSTDAVVIATEDRGDPFNYCGPATPIGRSLGAAVGAAIKEGIRRQHGWTPDRPIRARLAERGWNDRELGESQLQECLREPLLWESAFALDDAALAGRILPGPPEGFARHLARCGRSPNWVPPVAASDGRSRPVRHPPRLPSPRSRGLESRKPAG